jgi:hypothetical protein
MPDCVVPELVALVGNAVGTVVGIMVGLGFTVSTGAGDEPIILSGIWESFKKMCDST